MTFKFRLSAGAAVCVIAASISPVAAYAQQTTAAIQGVAVDEKGRPVGDASVTVIYQPSGAKVSTKANAAGQFDLRGLQVGGPYTVSGAAAEHETRAVDNLYLSVASSERVTLTLPATNRVAEVTVTAPKASKALVADVGSRTTIRAQAIEAVVTPKRDLRDVGRRDPLASLDFVTRGTGPTGGLYIAGSLPRTNRITIDGVRSQDDFGLNTGGLSTNRGPISLAAIEQVAVQDAPFDVEEGDFTGGALNVITKAGGNTFHGEGFGFTRTGRWVGTQLPFTAVTVDANGNISGPASGTHKVVNKIHESNEGGFLSGPIIKDKLFFALSYERYDSIDLTAAGPLGQGFATSFSPLPGISTGAGATAADIASAISGWNGYAGSSKLTPGVVSRTFPIIDEKASARIDWNIADGQHLFVTWRGAFSSVEKARSTSTTGIFLDTNTYAQPETENNFSGQLNSKWTERLSTEARVSYRDYVRGQTPPEGQGFSQFTICGDPLDAGATFSCSSGVPSISFGPDQFRQANVLNTSDLAAEFVANYRFGENHLLKFGYQYKGIKIYDLFVQQAHGVYYFDSVSDFAAGKANQLAFGNAFSGKATDAAAQLNYQVHTLFAQDTVDVTRDLTLNYGLRYDIYGTSSTPLGNANFFGRYGFTNQQTYGGLSVLMPRVSATWRQPDFELSAGFGLVSGGIPDVFITNSFGANTGAATNAINIRRQADGSFIDVNTSTVVDPALGAAILNLNKADATVASQPAAAAIALLNLDSVNRRTAYTNSLAPDFKLPSDWKANIAFQTRQLSFDWRVDGVVTRSQDSIAFRDLRARLLTQNGTQLLTPDGRLRYDGLNITAAQRAALGLPVSANPDLVNLGLNGDIQAYNPDTTNYSTTVAFTVAKRWRGLDGSLSYVLQRGTGLIGISEFGTTEGGNSTSGNYYADQTFNTDPNGAALGRLNNQINRAVKLNLSYSIEPKPGWLTRVTLFGEYRSGRPINFLFTDPAGNRNPTFGVSRDDALLYVPNLSTPNAANALQFTDNKGATVFFDSQKSLTSFTQLVKFFNIPQGGIVPRGVGHNPDVTRFDLQFEQDIPTPIRGHKLIATLDIANIGNLIDHNWGVVKEYGNSRAGVPIVNVQCADATGKASGSGSPVCAAYRYSYTTVNAANAATPSIDANSLYSIVIGLKYKF